MPVEYCARCKTVRNMHVATSRIQVLLPHGKATEIKTRTCYCPACNSFLLGEYRNKLPAQNHLKPVGFARKRAAEKTLALVEPPPAGAGGSPQHRDLPELLTRDASFFTVARKRFPPPAGAGGCQGAG